MNDALGFGVTPPRSRTDAAVPRATYRLQLHKGFDFAAAAHTASYLAGLGISHIYLSPILMARAGSTHGYDVVDHSRLNPELGGESAFRAMVATFHAHDLRVILDIVPNHMAVGGADNLLWLDVLEHGEASRYAGWFDIDWHPPTSGLDGKVLVPFLGESYGEALRYGALELRYDSGKFSIWAYGHHRLPLSPDTAAELAPEDVPRLNADTSALNALIERQHWRIAHSMVGDEEINYRRFFIVSDLAGIRIERPEVFNHVHQLPLQFVDEGLIDGLRIDHIDGLYDPAAYCRQLRAAASRPIYIVAEKILADGEALPAGWGIDGTTGYEFASQVTPLLVDPDGEAELTRFYQEFTGSADTPGELERAGKLRVVDNELAAELEALSWRFARLAATKADTRDLSRRRLKAALRGFVAAMPVYRTYVDRDGALPGDNMVVTAALGEAASREPDLDAAALAFIGRVLTGEDRSPIALDLALRTQQFTGPVMAKGLEDTALYRANRLIAIGDVGERPDRFSLSVADFHAAVAERAKASPHSMLTTTTHDSKRGEDARCRIAALSSHAAEWTRSVPDWLATLQTAGAPAIDPDDAYQIFQLLLGSWPGQPSVAFADRLVGATVKSLREARLRSSWLKPDSAYEGSVEGFIRTALDPLRGSAFLNAFTAFEVSVAYEGALNGLIETTLKLTLPGVPDIYQGAELWEQSMVDPDNRRAVDFSLRDRFLAESGEGSFDELLSHWRDGSVKQVLIARLLSLRAQHPTLFSAGSYEPISTESPSSEAVLAFFRQHDDVALLVVAQLYPGRGRANAGIWPATLKLPMRLRAAQWQPVLGAAPAEMPVGVYVASGLKAG